MTWSLSEAKKRFDELAKRAMKEGPQTIECGDGAVVVIDEAQYRRLTERKPTFKEHLLNGPSLEGVDLTRDRSPVRDINNL